MTGTLDVTFTLYVIPAQLQVRNSVSFDQKYRVLVQQENCSVAKDGSFSLPEAASVGTWEYGGKARNSRGNVGAGSGRAQGVLRTHTSGKILPTGVITLPLEWSGKNGQVTTSDGRTFPIGNASRFQPSGWAIQRKSETTDANGNKVWSYFDSRPTTFSGNWVAGAAQLQMIEEVQVEYRRKKKCNLEMTLRSEANGLTATFHIRVKNLGPDICNSCVWTAERGVYSSVGTNDFTWDELDRGIWNFADPATFQVTCDRTGQDVDAILPGFVDRPGEGRMGGALGVLGVNQWRDVDVQIALVPTAQIRRFHIMTRDWIVEPIDEDDPIQNNNEPRIGPLDFFRRPKP